VVILSFCGFSIGIFECTTTPHNSVRSADGGCKGPIYSLLIQRYATTILCIQEKNSKKLSGLITY
jgi:hypothetical protein